MGQMTEMSLRKKNQHHSISANDILRARLLPFACGENRPGGLAPAPLVDGVGQRSNVDDGRQVVELFAAPVGGKQERAGSYEISQ